MKKLSLIILVLVMACQLQLIQAVDSPSLPTDPGRVTIASNSYGKTVARDNGETLLRGNAIWIWRAKLLNKFSDVEYAFDPSYYQTLVDSGTNTIRLVYFDPWMNSNGYTATDFTNPDHLDYIFDFTDSIIDFASQFDLNVMVSYMDVLNYKGEYQNPDAESIGYLKEFWEAVAPHYKDRTHVFYELWNEPAGYPNEFKDELLDSMACVYEIIRDLAPQTHISLFSFAAICSPWPGYHNTTMYDKVERFEELHPGLVDWGNASVNFHAYGHYNVSNPILELMEAYPVITNETNFPLNEEVPVIGRDAESQSLDGELFINQTMEKFGISWIQHKASGTEKFENWGLILENAREQGYIWFGDRRKLQVEFDDTKGIVTAVSKYNPVNVPLDSGVFLLNSQAKITAIPEPGYKFDHWTGDIGGENSNEDTISISMNSNKTVTAHFIENTDIILTWAEDFDLPVDWANYDNGETAWSIQNGLNKFGVVDGYIYYDVFRAADENEGEGEGEWITENVDVSSVNLVNLYVDLARIGNLKITDSLNIYYVLDGGSRNLVATRKANFIDSGWERIISDNINVSSINEMQVVITATTSHEGKCFFWDNIVVEKHDTISTISDPRKTYMANNNIKIYPNPLSSGIAYLELAGYQQDDELNISIFSVLGGLIDQKEVTIKPHQSNIVELLKHELTAEGIYIIQINNENILQSIKLIVQ